MSRSSPPLRAAIRSIACSLGRSPAAARRKRYAPASSTGAMRERGSSSIETGGDQVTRGWARRWLFLGATALVAGLLTAASASTAAEAAQTKPLARHPAPATPQGKPPPAHAAPAAGRAVD